MAIKIEPKDPQAYYNRGLVNYTLGNYHEAVSDNSKAL